MHELTARVRAIDDAYMTRNIDERQKVNIVGRLRPLVSKLGVNSFQNPTFCKEWAKIETRPHTMGPDGLIQFGETQASDVSRPDSPALSHANFPALEFPGFEVELPGDSPTHGPPTLPAEAGPTPDDEKKSCEHDDTNEETPADLMLQATDREPMVLYRATGPTWSESLAGWALTILSEYRRRFVRAIAPPVSVLALGRLALSPLQYVLAKPLPNAVLKHIRTVGRSLWGILSLVALPKPWRSPVTPNPIPSTLFGLRDWIYQAEVCQHPLLSHRVPDITGRIPVQVLEFVAQQSLGNFHRAPGATGVAKYESPQTLYACRLYTRGKPTEHLLTLDELATSAGTKFVEGNNDVKRIELINRTIQSMALSFNVPPVILSAATDGTRIHASMAADRSRNRVNTHIEAYTQNQDFRPRALAVVASTALLAMAAGLGRSNSQRRLLSGPVLRLAGAVVSTPAFLCSIVSPPLLRGLLRTLLMLIIRHPLWLAVFTATAVSWSQ